MTVQQRSEPVPERDSSSEMRRPFRKRSDFGIESLDTLPLIPRDSISMSDGQQIIILSTDSAEMFVQSRTSSSKSFFNPVSFD